MARGYDPDQDKVLAELGEIVLKTDGEGNPSSILKFKIRQYSDQEPKFAITHWFTSRDGSQNWESSKVPRMVFDQVQLLTNQVPKMLGKAIRILDNPQKSKKNFKRKKK
jgi:hypothetical protein